MNNTIADFIHVKQIDSFQKLRLLLFLEQYPDTIGPIQEPTAQVYFGSTSLVEKTIIDLQKTGLLVSADHNWHLSDKPDIRAGIQHLAKVFEDPLTRKDLLEQIGRMSFNRHHNRPIGL